MGLDITAYEHVDLVEAVSPEGMRARDWAYDDVADVYLSNVDDFVARGDRIVDGIYRPRGKKLTWPMGSYHAYGYWRDALARLVRRPPRSQKPGPFAELIWFADNEGFLGPVTSAKLYGDFVAWEKRANRVTDPRWFPKGYLDFKRGLEVAGGAGVVHFH